MNHEEQKTVFISSFYGLIGRNILSTGFLKKILDNPVKVVIFLPKEKEESYRKIFGSENVFVEGISYEESSYDKFLASIFFSLHGIENARINRAGLISQGKYAGAFFSFCLSKIGRFKLIRKIARSLDYRFATSGHYKKYFEKYKPDLVFATDIFRHQDVDMMREAKKHRILTLGMVRSWDNVSTKGLNRFIPDKMIVHGEHIKEEIVKYCDIEPSKISIVGIPHYDRYITEGRTNREVFFKKFNLDPNKKTLILSPPLRSYTSDPVPETIVNALLPFDNIQTIIRMTLVGKSNIGNLKPIPNKLAIDAPESAENFDQADMTNGDDHLMDLLYHCDVLASHVSTIAIDAIVFGKPAIYVGFNTNPVPYHESIRRFFDLDCARDLVSTGGVELIESLDDFIKCLLRHFADPALGKEGRQNLIHNYCFRLDGKSSERLANVVIDVLYCR
jgi:hypothetical protein